MTILVLLNAQQCRDGDRWNLQSNTGKCTHVWTNRVVYVLSKAGHRTAAPVLKDMQVGPTSDLEEEQNE